MAEPNAPTSAARTLITRGIVSLLAVALTVVAAGSSTACSDGSGAGGSTQGYRGAITAPAVAKPKLVLNDTDGRPFDLQKETQGSVLLLYVGYTHCPDVCPTHMADIAAALKAMPAELAAKVKVVFITSDPARDTALVLRSWLRAFDASFIGLVPTAAELDGVVSTLGMPPIEKEEVDGANYSVVHAAYVLAYGINENTARLAYPSGIGRTAYVHDLPLLAAAK